MNLYLYTGLWLNRLQQKCDLNVIQTSQQRRNARRSMVSCGVMRLLQWDILVLDFVVRALEKINVNKLLGLVEVNEW